MVTIVVPVSKPEFIDRFFASLELMDTKGHEVNILAYVDGSQDLFQKTRNLIVNSKFKQKLCVYRKKGIPNASHIKSRRQRISDIHNELKDLVNPCEYILMTEDDTIIPTNGFKDLMKTASEHPHAGIVSGVQVGRWGYEYIGAWKADDVYDTKALSSVWQNRGVEQVDAMGFYFCLIRYNDYIKHHFEPYQQILGPDLNFGLWMRQQGYKNFINHDIRLSHITKREVITVANSQIVQVKYRKDESYEQGWEQIIVNNIHIK